VADSRKWITHQEAYQRVLATLRSFESQENRPDSALVEGKFGMFFHFVDQHTGRWKDRMDCVSTADTAMLMAGVITCGEYFKGTEIEALADRIFRACQWDTFMLNNENRPQDFIAMGYVPPGQPSSWTREQGFFGRYQGYADNSFMIYLLALASPAHSIPVDTWYQSQCTYRQEEYHGMQIVAAHPPGLAFQYYPHAWLDLRFQKDQVMDYFQNTVKAVQAQQEYCSQEGGYPDGLWGLSSSQSDKGYEAFGAPLSGSLDRGILTPHAIAGGMVFTPEKALAALKRIYATRRSQTWGAYGFTDAFSVRNEWSSPYVLGLDEGPIVLMIENYRTGLIWKTFSRNRHIREALRKIGFVGVIEDFEKPSLESGYSRYALSRENAGLQPDDPQCVEGKRCLRIRPKSGEPLTLELKPHLRDFSQYAYLSLWGRDIQNLQVSLQDGQGRRALLETKSEASAGSWKRYYYSLKKTKNLEISEIQKVVLSMSPAPAALTEGLRLDGIVLTDEEAAVPPPPANLKASVPQANAVVRVVFQQPAKAYQYDIRFSRSPIRSEEDFENLPVSQESFFAAFKSKEREIFLTLPEKGGYYLAVKSLDAMGLRSKMISCGPVFVARSRADEILTDFQKDDLVSPAAEWRGSAEFIRLSMARAPDSPARRALKVQYQKNGAWDYIEINFQTPLDVSPYRFLKLRVFGRERILAKLFNTVSRQEDIAEARALQADRWNELKFDLSGMRADAVDKKHIQKILLFLAPGEIAYGTVYIDKLWLSSQ
jgi:hypothetical protein